jgi:enamine deaminase RidA (YjgF/YER057c/UK114 family)
MEKQSSRIAARLQELGITLAAPWQPKGMSFVPCVRSGNLLFVSGHGPRQPDGSFVNGKLGQDLDWRQGYEAARLVALDLLATMQGELGDLDKVKRIVRLFGMVNSAPDFTRQPQVINGASDLLVAVFGYERGSHARSAVGMAALPTNIAIEIEMIVELEPDLV